MTACSSVPRGQGAAAPGAGRVPKWVKSMKNGQKWHENRKNAIWVPKKVVRFRTCRPRHHNILPIGTPLTAYEQCTHQCYASNTTHE